MNADIVAIEIIARMDKLERETKAQTDKFEREMKRMERSAGQAEAAIARAGGTMGGAFKLPTAQAAMASTALRGLTLVSSTLGGVIGGAVTGGVLLLVDALVSLVFRSKDSSSEVEKLLQKLREQERQARNSALANGVWEQSLDGMIAKTRKLNEETRRLLETEQERTGRQSSAEASQLAAYEKRIAEIAKEIERSKAKISAAETIVANAAQAGGRSAQGAVDTIAKEKTKLRELAKEYNLLQVSIGQAKETLGNLTVLQARIKAEDLVDPIKAKFNALRAEAERTIKDVDKLAAALARIDKQEEAARKKAKPARSGRDPGELSNFISPVGGSLSGRYGEQRGNRRHAGIDLAVPVGTNVQAAASGTVITTGNLPGYGNVVIVDHGGGTTTRYAHLSRILAQKGQSVGQGDVIGLSGGAKGAPGAGNSQGPHLHYEVRRNGRAVDPTKGQYATDAAGAGQKAETLQARIDRERERAAEEALRNDRRYQDQIAALNERILQLKEGAATSLDEILQIQLAQIDADRAAADRAVDRDLADGEITAAKAEELRLLNATVAGLQAREAARKVGEERQKRAEEAAQKLVDYQVAELEYASDMATNRRDQLDLQLKIIDLVYDQQLEQLRLNQALALYSGNVEEAARIQADINAAEQAKRQAAGRTERQYESPLAAAARDATDISDELDNLALNSINGFSDAIAGAISGTKDLKQAFGEMARSIIADLVQMIVKALIFKALQAAFGGKLGFAEGGPVKAATGGRVVGPGTGTSDSIPAMLSNGEFVIRRRVVDKLGAGALHFINQTGELPRRFAAGGEVNRRIQPSNGRALASNAYGTRNGPSGPPMVFDLRGAVVTEDLLRQMNVIASRQSAQAGQTAYESARQDAPRRFDQLQRLGT